MLQGIDKEIFKAIKADDIKAFRACMQDAQALTLSYGRFPILSLCYLYNSRHIIKEFEDKLLQIRSYTIYPENSEMYILFKSKAKRCIRLYAGKDCIVHPLEMLCILNKKTRVEAVYPKAIKTNSTIENIKMIESIKYSKEVEATETKIVLPKQPIDKNFIKTSLAAMAILLVVAIVFSVLGGFVYSLGNGSEDRPYKVVGESQLIKAIESNSYVILDRDIEVDNLDFDSYSGIIDGNGHTITINNQTGTIFKEISGTIKNVNFSISLNYETKTSASVLVTNLTGTLDGVNVDILGNLKYTGNAASSVTLYLSVYSNENNGTIKNCVLNSNLNIIGNGVNDVVFGGFSAQNKKTISDIEVKGNIEMQEVNGAVVSYINEGTIENALNVANINQTTNAFNCDLMVASMAIKNFGNIKNAINEGKISLKATNEKGAYVFMGGIACDNYLTIEHSKNIGEIICDGEYFHAKIGGIASTGEYYFVDNYPTFDSCASLGKVSVITVNSYSRAYVGGIYGGYREYDYINNIPVVLKNSYSMYEVNLEGTFERSLIGGLAGLWSRINNPGTYLINSAYLFNDSIKHGLYACYESFFEYVYNAYDSGEGMFSGYNNEDEIKALEIYW